MTMTCGGLAKLIEECGELVQVCGKKLACFTTDAHWDGSDLKSRMEDEMGDVIGAIHFVQLRRGLDFTRIMQRARAKLALFEQWDADSGNNTNGVDSTGSVQAPMQAARPDDKTSNAHSGNLAQSATPDAHSEPDGSA